MKKAIYFLFITIFCLNFISTPVLADEEVDTTIEITGFTEYLFHCQEIYDYGVENESAITLITVADLLLRKPDVQDFSAASILQQAKKYAANNNELNSLIDVKLMKATSSRGPAVGRMGLNGMYSISKTIAAKSKYVKRYSFKGQVPAKIKIANNYNANIKNNIKVYNSNDILVEDIVKVEVCNNRFIELSWLPIKKELYKIVVENPYDTKIKILFVTN